MTARRKRTNIDFQEEQEKQELPKPKVFEKLCAANGCPCMVWCGQLAQGINVCEFHEGIEGKYFPQVTAGLLQYRELIELAENLQRDWKLIDDYNSTIKHPHVIQSLTDYFCSIGIPELCPKTNIPCIPIEGKRHYRDESAYDLGNRIKKWVKNNVVKPGMIKNSEENQKDKKIEEISPLTAYIRQLKQRAIQRQQDAETYF